MSTDFIITLSTLTTDWLHVD